MAKRPAQDSVVFKSEEYRIKKEVAHALKVTKTPSELYGRAYWRKSLRGQLSSTKPHKIHIDRNTISK